MNNEQVELPPSSKEPWWTGPYSFITISIFLGCWGYSLVQFGWFLGLAFGWIPSLIIAAIWPAVAGISVWCGVIALLILGLVMLIIWLLGG